MPKDLRLMVYAKCGGRCAYCGERCLSEKADLEKELGLC
jgi:molybdenum cofactor biosynthesis enzyme MoaA